MKSILKGLGFADAEERKEEKIIAEEDIIHSKNQNAKNLIVYAPKINDELNSVIMCLIKGEPVIIDLAGLKQRETERVLDYVNGSLFAINGTINRIQGSLYLLAPNGYNLSSLKTK